MSDFHKFVLTVLKAKYIKAKPKIIMYRDYKEFGRELFRNDLSLSLGQSVQIHFAYSSFQIEIYRNYCVKLFRCEKKRYYEKLNNKLITDDKKFWCTVKHSLSNMVPFAIDVNYLGVKEGIRKVDEPNKNFPKSL